MPHHDEDDSDGLLEEGRRPPASGGMLGFGGLCACLSVEYYQPYFDVDTDEVLNRIKYALMFCGEGSPFLDVVREKPDAYGPWWISTTLVFLISVTSHLKTLMDSTAKYDFTVVSLAAMTIYSYLGVTALAMWLALNYWLKVHLSILQCTCIVGYSLSVYVLAAFFCVLPFAWPILLVAWVLSTLFAAKCTLPVIDHLDKQNVIAFVVGLAVCNSALMLTIRLALYARVNDITAQN